MTACATDPVLETTTQDLIGGKDSIHRRNIGRLVFNDSSWCTGTLVADNIVLTAGHCVPNMYDAPGGAQLGDFRIDPAYPRDPITHSYGFDGWIALSRSIGVDDIALVHLDGHVPRSVSVRARITPSRPSNGALVDVYGYGSDEYGCPSQTPNKNHRAFRVGVTPTYMCPGDSGGPVFTPEGFIFAMNSFSGGNGDGFSHPYAYYNWIYANGAKLSAADDDNTPPTLSSLTVSGGVASLSATDNNRVDFVKFFVDDEYVGIVDHDGPSYSIAVPLGNVRADAFDDDGNRSIISNAPPPAPTGLHGDAISWGEVWLDWTRVNDPSTAGYILRRNGVVVLFRDKSAGTGFADHPPESSWLNYELFTYSYAGTWSTAASKVTTFTPAGPNRSEPLWRYWNGNNTDHYYTIDRNDGGLAYFAYGIETNEGYGFRYNYYGTVPVYQYWNPYIGDHFYTTSWNEIGGGGWGWGYETVAFYVFPVNYAGTVALYRYYNGSDHFYTKIYAPGGFYDYWMEGILGYVYP